MPRIARHKTAMKRTGLSRPLKLVLDDGLLTPERPLFDYGCGHGGDVRRLRSQGFSCVGWDPVHQPRVQRKPTEIVNIGYVVNVIEDPDERAATLLSAWSLTERLMIVSARLKDEEKDLRAATDYSDGCLTGLGTFQKFYDQSELRAWIEYVLDVPPLPAAPGVFYVFKDEELRQGFLASRYRRRVAAPRIRKSDLDFERHKDLLEPLIEFVAGRGRLPELEELPSDGPHICDEFQTLKNAFALVRRVTGKEAWETVKDGHREDLLIYLALVCFEGRPKFGHLPPDLQLDVRAFFGTYKKACESADQLLFSVADLESIYQACGASPVGKKLPNALYVHIDALDELPTLLRVYEGCARGLVGAVEGANLIKLHRNKPAVSYLSYPDFEKDPHPALARSLRVALDVRRTKLRRFDKSSNPPILHRKETFLPAEHPLREKFARLTRQEEDWGLLADPSAIGTRDGWETVLRRTEVTLRGHRIVRTSTSHADCGRTRL